MGVGVELFAHEQQGRFQHCLEVCRSVGLFVCRFVCQSWLAMPRNSCLGKVLYTLVMPIPLPCSVYTYDLPSLKAFSSGLYTLRQDEKTPLVAVRSRASPLRRGAWCTYMWMSHLLNRRGFKSFPTIVRKMLANSPLFQSWRSDRVMRHIMVFASDGKSSPRLRMKHYEEIRRRDAKLFSM